MDDFITAEPPHRAQQPVLLLPVKVLGMPPVVREGREGEVDSLTVLGLSFNLWTAAAVRWIMWLVTAVQWLVAMLDMMRTFKHMKALLETRRR